MRLGRAHEGAAGAADRARPRTAPSRQAIRPAPSPRIRRPAFSGRRCRRIRYPARAGATPASDRRPMCRPTLLPPPIPPAAARTLLANDAAFAALDEVDEGADLRLGQGRLLEFLQSRLQFQPRAVHHPIGAAYVPDLLGGEAPP